MEENKQTFRDLVASKIPEIAEAAQRMQVYALDLETSRITQEEYEDLLQDITNLKHIDEKLFQVEVYREISEAFQYLATLKTIASFI